MYYEIVPMDRSHIDQIAALEIGSVRIMPITTDTRMPMGNGRKVVAVEMKTPR